MHLVIFDCDGTLVDSQYMIAAAMERAFAGAGLLAPSREAVRRVVGLSLVPAVAELLPASHLNAAPEIADAYKAHFGELRLRRAHEEPLYPGVRAALAALAARPDTCLAMATGKSRRGVAAVIEREGLEGLFHSIQTADTHPSKPDPSMVHAAMAETGAGPQRTIVIGDTTFDMAMARNAGVHALGVAWGYHGTDELHAAGAHHIVAGGHEIVPAVAQLLRWSAA